MPRALKVPHCPPVFSGCGGALFFLVLGFPWSRPPLVLPLSACHLAPKPAVLSRAPCPHPFHDVFQFLSIVFFFRRWVARLNATIPSISFSLLHASLSSRTIWHWRWSWLRWRCWPCWRWFAWHGVDKEKPDAEFCGRVHGVLGMWGSVLVSFPFCLRHFGFPTYHVSWYLQRVDVHTAIFHCIGGRTISSPLDKIDLEQERYKNELLT